MAFEDLQPTAYGVATVMFILGTVSIFLRLYCRSVILKTFGWDDVMAVFLLLVNTTQQAILYIFLHYGCGIHITLLSAYQIESIVKWLFIEEIFYMFTHWTIKQAFLLFYLRLSPQKNFRRMVLGTMVLNTAFTAINWMLAFLQCIPFDAILHAAAHPGAKCINKLVLLIVPSILNIITDMIILILPISTVWSLQMSIRRKIGVLAVIGFGASAVLISALRLIILYELYISPDLSYVLGKMVIVAALEVEFAVMAVNLPSVKALWNQITGGSSSGSGAASGYSGAYKLSSMERKRDGQYKQSSKVSGGRSGNRGSVTMLEQGVMSNESEEELFRQQGIKVTTNVAVTMGDKGESDTESGRRGYGGYQHAR
ncbi:hypothetical protein AOQ84DRAFT_366094 [Glonium stellatum]|uniref:Rhodopsin domain-containing protein n=1 Tax=Glonium stellatum TaxID=574774 RepID=A0A8E2EWW9_9PEZI|nr:hypothetical protein AOQ84DRAFT_366094 [Glonium stellatum]